MTNENNKPMRKVRAGLVTATIWKKEAKTKEGETFDSYTVSVERSYKDNEGNWKKTSSFNLNDLPKVAAVTQKAYEAICITHEINNEEK